MRGYTHMAVGVAAALLISDRLGIEFTAMSAAISVLGSLLPDADEEHSMINKHIPFHHGKLAYSIGAAALFYQAYRTGNIILVLLAVTALLIYLSGHRGFAHSLLACGLFSLTFYSDIGRLLQFAAAYMSHILVDMLNTKGEQLLYPFKKRYKLPIGFPMDSAVGKAVELALCYGSVLIIGKYMQIKL